MNDNNPLLQRVIKERNQYIKRCFELSLHPHQSKEVTEVFTAFCKAQSEFPQIEKNVKGQYKYAGLSNILQKVIPVLTKNNLMLIQYISRDNILHTRIAHVTGQFFESQFKIPIPNEEDHKGKVYIQEVGTRRTYTRRYELITLLGICPDEDTDGR